MKRRRALLESNPPRNSQLETHRDDEAGGGGKAVPGPIESHRIERFPDAWENSYRKLPRSGLLVLRGEVGFELGRRQVAERRVKPFLVVDLFQKLADRRAGLGQIAVFVAVAPPRTSAFS